MKIIDLPSDLMVVSTDQNELRDLAGRLINDNISFSYAGNSITAHCINNEQIKKVNQHIELVKS